VPLPDGSSYVREFSRAEFEGLVQPILDRTIGPVQMALADAGLKPADVDEVVLVGGSTRVPLVRRMVEQLFGRRPHAELNPDEVVALGAAIQANILESGVKDMLLLDVTPLSLGIETMGGVVAKIIPRNSTIPASAQEMFTTGVDSQTGIDIHVLQGERELAADCRSLARFQLRVPPGPAGLARIEVKFLIDASGILQVSARDLKTGQEHSVEVQPSYGLSDAEIEHILEESIENAEQDFNLRQLIEARNEAETILRATEKSLAGLAAGIMAHGEPPEELGHDLPPDLPPDLPQDEGRAINAAIAALRSASAGDDYKLIRVRVDELNQATMPLAERLMNRALSSALAGKRLSDV
jgi:molecular chaperone DnaK (HSP70)